MIGVQAMGFVSQVAKRLVSGMRVSFGAWLGQLISVHQMDFVALMANQLSRCTLDSVGILASAICVGCVGTMASWRPLQGLRKRYGQIGRGTVGSRQHMAGWRALVEYRPGYGQELAFGCWASLPCWPIELARFTWVSAV